MRSKFRRDHELTHNVQLPTLKTYFEENRSKLDPSDPKGVVDKYILHMQSGGDDSKQACFSGLCYFQLQSGVVCPLVSVATLN